MIEKHPEPVPNTEGDVLGRRIGAYLVDGLVVFLGSVLLLGTVGVLGAFLQSIAEPLALGIFLLGGLAWLALVLYYSFLMEGHYGRTLGKGLFGLVVVKEDGQRCTTGSSIVRNLLWIVDGMGVGPLIVALICFITDRNQRVGDLVAGTVVLEAR